MPVQSALVFCLELTLVTIKSEILVVFHYMDVQLFPFIESLFTMFAGVYLVKPLVVLLYLALVNVFVITVVTLAGLLLYLDLSLEAVCLLTVIHHQGLAGLQVTEPTAVRE